MKLGNAFQQSFFAELPGVRAGAPTASQNFRTPFPTISQPQYMPGGLAYGGFNPFFMMMQLMMQLMFKLLHEHQKPADPPVEDPPVDDPPSVSGDFPPGSLAQDEVPVDAAGNIKSDFLQEMLTPKNAVNTNLFDSSDPSGLSKFARIGIRLMGHDLYDGQINGDVVLRTLLNPEGSHNTAFTTTPEVLDMVKEWGREDLQDDGKINGSVYAKLTEEVWPTTDNANIDGFLTSATPHNASLNVAELFKQTPNLETPEGITQWTQQTGVPLNDLLNLSLWGHRILDRNVSAQQLASNALNDPTSLDFGFTHFNADTQAFVQSLATDPNAKSTMGIKVLNFLRRQF